MKYMISDMFMSDDDDLVFNVIQALQSSDGEVKSKQNFNQKIRQEFEL